MVRVAGDPDKKGRVGSFQVQIGGLDIETQTMVAGPNIHIFGLSS